ncbi:arylsulfatase [Paenibacillus sp. OV219]|uniref:arylsulfatase n=1 Tax=Paenibacillus sp. OV219 TaxID=1884377 RepID=UPI0008C269FD|nr:arylsulfatase [Paenibacillus sp. OV219]SEO52672.1 Arylsulfatase A [Paenibacillus sp. OV219]
MQPNILLITVDQMRGDCLHYLGHPVIQTPNLDNLARNGATFTNAYTATPSCVPARAAIMTGMKQENHGRVGYQDSVPWNYEHTIAGEFAAAGYHTQCVGKMHVYPTRNLCGFHNVVLHDGYMHYNRDRSKATPLSWWDQCDDYVNWLREKAGSSVDIMDNGLDCNASTVARPWHLDESLHPTNWAVTQSIDFLRRRDPSKPFFLWTSFVRPHPPLDPPQAFLDLYDGLELPQPPIGDWADRSDSSRDGLNPTTGRGIVHERMRQRALAAYYALITHVDHQIGRLLNALFEYGVRSNTIILFTSDHGELMGDHLLYKKILPYEGSAKVPFILSDPTGTLELKNGKLVDDVIELQDIMPTLLHAAAVPIPSSVDGMSVIPLAQRVAKNEVAWRAYIHGEHSYGELSSHYLTDGKCKYIWLSQTGQEQLFDLEHDPQELCNLAGLEQHEHLLTLWRGRLISELNGREEGYSDGSRLIVGQTPVNVLSHLLASNDH